MDDIKESLLGDVEPVSNNFTELDIKKSKPMGVGKLGDPSIVFVRKFRWTLEGKNLEENFLKKVEFDFKAKTIKLDAMEIAETGKDINIHQWLESDLSKEDLKFTTYDGCGSPLYSYWFSNIEVIADTCDFDYFSSEESTRHITLTYELFARKCHLVKTKVPVTSNELVKKHFHLMLSVDDGMIVPQKVKVTHRPALKIEESEINYLGDKMWVPGKKQWTDIHFELDEKAQCILADLINKTDLCVRMKMFDMSGRLLETWILKQCKLMSMNKEDEKMIITLNYGEVHYESATYPSVKSEVKNA